MLNDKQKRFVFEYVKDFNATQSAIRAGYSEASAATQAHDLLRNPKIVKALEERREEVAAATLLDASWVLKQWIDIAAANPNDLIQVRKVCCRFCYGLGHNYQWTNGEYITAVNAALIANKKEPQCVGGFGYDPNKDPNPDCPECGGNGTSEVHLMDTRKLTGPAKRLYAGVRKTKDGVQVLMRDQDAALQNLAKYLGMLVEKTELTGAKGGPLAIASLSPDDLTDAQLAAIIAASAPNGSDA